MRWRGFELPVIKSMTPIDLVAVSTASSPLASPEFRHGWQRLRSTFAPAVAWLEVAQPGRQALLSEVVHSPVARALPDSARVLLLAHGHVLLTRGVLAHLASALDSKAAATAVHAFDSGYPPPQAPDYCTLHGMERFLERLDHASPAAAPDEGSQHALVTLTTLGAVRKGLVLDRAFWIPTAYVHDFSNYHQGRREEVLPLVPEDTRRLLDVGGGEGGFLIAAKEALVCETHLAEYSADACRLASQHVDHVWQGDFFTQTFMTSAQQQAAVFDCITFLDVLEHTSDPQLWLERARTLLAPGGVVVASIPNVGHWGVIADLLEGRWDYCPVGIHCVTHLRFFTEHSVQELFTQCGYEIDRIEFVKVPCPTHWAEHWTRTPGLQTLPGSWDTYAFLVRARPTVNKGAQ